MAETKRKLSDLSPEQRDLIFRRLRQEDRAPRPVIPRRKDREAPFPLSFAQERLWLLEQLQPGTAFYNVTLAVRVTGSCDIGLLQAALDAMVWRHETLRTTFQFLEGQAVQVIAPRGESRLRLVDLGGLPALRAEAVAQDLYRDEARRGFDLGKGPLLRTTLLRLAPESHALLLVFHHIISDLRSLQLFVRELTQTYLALERGGAAALPELPIQYADYAAWQREQMQGERLAREIESWRQEIAGAAIAIELPTDHPRPPVLGSRGASVDLELPSATVTERLKALGRAEDATLYMVLLTAYSVLLARYSSQQDLLVGSAVANRTRVELEGLIGFFVGMLVVRADLKGLPSFRELLGRIRERSVRALNRQDLPFQQLVDQMGVERDLSRQPLIQATFALQNVSVPTLELAGLRFEAMRTQVGIAKFDLHVGIAERDGALKGALEYSSTLFERATAVRLGRHLGLILEGMATDPDCRIWELPLLSRAERQQLLGRGPRPQEPAPESLTALLAAVARRQPAAPAVAWPAGELSYSELAARSGRVAAGLRALGVGPEVLVGLVLGRSPELLVGIAGVLAAGGACLLLDPAREQSWLEQVLERSGLAVVLTRERLLGRLPEHGAEEVALERLAAAQGVAPFQDAAPESLAFVVQTSGAGQPPRLVALEHRTVAAWVRHWRERLSPHELAAVEGVSALESADAVFDLIVPLCLGGCVALGRPAAGAPGLLSATPPELATRLRQGALEGLRAVRCFGQPLSRSLAQRLHAAGVQRVHDSYSSTVGGIWEWHEGPRGEPAPAAYVLNRAGEPAPVGAAGELWLAEEGMARGYAGNAAWTAQRFVPDLFGRRAGGRLVRTGDLARWRGDGKLELLGGGERQVEVRGLRLQLDALEQLLADHPQVLQAAARLQTEDHPVRLIAYVAAAGADAALAELLLEYLRARLPEPQVPWTVVVLDELPRTPAGRVDLQSLPRVDAVVDYVAPRTEVEKILAEILCELLRFERVGIRENFFRLGGNSLLATQAVARINDALHVNLGVEVLFRHPNIESLALVMDELLLAQLDDEDLEGLLGGR